MPQDFDLPLFASADQIRRREFVATRRGYDPDQVRAYLDQLADQVEQLEGMVRDARQRADAASGPKADPYQEVAARVAGAIRAADESAQRMLSEAEGKVGELLADARKEADRIRAEAQATADAALASAETLVREASDRAGKTANELTARRELVLEHLGEMRERLVAAAGQIEEVIRSRGEDLPPLAIDASPPPRITVEGPSVPASGPAAPTAEPTEATVIDPAYADLWKAPEGDGLEVPEIPSIDLSWGDLEEPDAGGGSGGKRKGSGAD